MKMPKFDYARPDTLDEAVQLLSRREGSKILSGGQSLLPILAFRMASPSMLIDIQRLKGLSEITNTPNGLRVGSRVRWCQIEEDADLPDVHPLFQSMISHVAHYQIRNRGTVGGSLAHADPAAEMPGVAIVCDCEIAVTGSSGSRAIKAADFFVGALETALAEDEIITEVRFPPWPKSRKWAFREFARRRGDFAIAGVAIFYDQDEMSRIRNAHVGVIGVADVPRRLAEVEAALNGQLVTQALIDNVRSLTSDCADPGTDIHGSAEYRKSLVGTLAARALCAAAGMGSKSP
jgi:aerobic carbon-monoxide dehydrogenase medium subunit